MAEAGKPTTKTLRPDLEESVDFEKSENVFITGDNLEVLKILQESYLGKIDMIYIDPPYNTGKDFVYSDKFQMSEEKLEEELEIIDEQGQKKIGLTKNEKTSARYHSDWLNMMYPRLVLARNLLKESGVIFISIDDNEQANLKAICDEIFGEENFVADLIWTTKKAAQGMTTKQMIVSNHETILVYSKYCDLFSFEGMDRDVENGFSNPDNDPRGLWKRQYLQRLGQGLPIRRLIDPNSGNVFEFETPYTQEKIDEWIKDNRIIFPESTDKYPIRKEFINEYKNKQQLVSYFGYYPTKATTEKLYQLFRGTKIFTNPKPDNLILDILRYTYKSNLDAIVLDFFAGSATTADAVMQLNAEDGGNRKYILCTLNEEVAEKSAAKEAGYQTIDQISRERIRRAAQKIQEEHPETIGKLDVGFRAYMLDSSNFKDVGQKPGAFTQENLFDSVSNIKEGRSDFDLLFQIMLNWGMELSLPIVQSEIEGIRVFDVADGSLFACFADDMTESVIRKIAKERPLRAVFKDESFANSAGKINLMQIFKEESPETKVKVV
ncbi:site-specific DNA-methyltransferase [Streptococcus sp. 121]|uniref:site-specific DNA-methyltransferase n=1 Tax=Streptococcus sp. 121 TaxID=2797637 RepID=UPI0018F0A81C|nr:site-specific DNA-methyltransferase [Streptococcus sp. 121]MBJ6744951.1 site-specific DNA-methyltransferase [Streptococcus sp. 121]